MKKVDHPDFVIPHSSTKLYASVTEIEAGKIKTGELSSLDSDVRFPILRHIPRFVSSQNYASNFGLQWKRHAKTQLDSFNGADYSKERLFSTTGWPKNMTGETILEIGSGAGRFTEILATTAALVTSVDYSEAVEANLTNNGHAENVRIVQADVYSLPFPEGSFDRVLCLGVLQHTPDVEKTFQSLARMVRPGGALAIDVYRRHWKHLLHWKYLMRPFTTRMDPESLYRFVEWYAPKLIPAAKLARSVAGRAGTRLVPILDQSDKKVGSQTQIDWTILDTFDALGPLYDHPQDDRTIRHWFGKYGFQNVVVAEGKGTGVKAKELA